MTTDYPAILMLGSPLNFWRAYGKDKVYFNTVNNQDMGIDNFPGAMSAEQTAAAQAAYAKPRPGIERTSSVMRSYLLATRRARFWEELHNLAMEMADLAMQYDHSDVDTQTNMEYHRCCQRYRDKQTEMNQWLRHQLSNEEP